MYLLRTRFIASLGVHQLLNATCITPYAIFSMVITIIFYYYYFNILRWFPVINYHSGVVTTPTEAYLPDCPFGGRLTRPASARSVISNNVRLVILSTVHRLTYKVATIKHFIDRSWTFHRKHDEREIQVPLL